MPSSNKKIDFEQAIKISTKNAESLLGKLQNMTLESALISEDKKLYEISLSYDIQGKDPFEIEPKNGDSLKGIAQLAKIMGRRKQYKTFLVDSRNGTFRGFKNQRDC